MNIIVQLWVRFHFRDNKLNGVFIFKQSLSFVISRFYQEILHHHINNLFFSLKFL